MVGFLYISFSLVVVLDSKCQSSVSCRLFPGQKLYIDIADWTGKMDQWFKKKTLTDKCKNLCTYQMDMEIHLQSQHLGDGERGSLEQVI